MMYSFIEGIQKRTYSLFFHETETFLFSGAPCHPFTSTTHAPGWLCTFVCKLQSYQKTNHIDIILNLFISKHRCFTILWSGRCIAQEPFFAFTAFQMHELPTLKPHHNVPAHPASHHHQAHQAHHVHQAHHAHHHLPVPHHAAPVHHLPAPVHHQPAIIHHPVVNEEMPAPASGAYPPTQPTTFFSGQSHPIHHVAHPVVHSTGVHPAVHVPPVHLPNGGAFTAFVDLGGQGLDNSPKSERLVISQPSPTPSSPPSVGAATSTTTSTPDANLVLETSTDSGKSEKMEKLLAMAMQRLKMMEHMEEMSGKEGM